MRFISGTWAASAVAKLYTAKSVFLSVFALTSRYPLSSGLMPTQSMAEYLRWKSAAKGMEPDSQ